MTGDTTDRRNIEAMTSRLGRMVEDSLNEIYVFDAENFKFIQANRGALANLGYSMEELHDLTPLDLEPEFSAETFAGMVRPLRDGEQDSIRFETVHRRKDGSDYNVEVRLQLMQTETPPVFIAFILDVTERIRAEEQLRQAQKMEAIGRLTGGVAHDFNNILMVVQGNLELLEDKLETEEQRNLVKRAIGGAERAAMMTQRLLSFARKQPLQPRGTDINHLVSGMTGMLRRTLGEHIRIETRLAEGLWNAVIDPSGLESAIVNLAVNARDAMKDGGTLTVETANARLDAEYAASHEEVEPGEYVRLTIADTGQGMPAEMLDSAFEPFVTTKEVGAGSGLGLSMVYGYVGQSGGHVKIHSAPGKGTAIHIHLPRQMSAADARPDWDSPYQTPLGKGETVLVVEDDPDVRSLAVGVLEDLGYPVIEAEDGATALKLVERSGHIDLLFTDVVLPSGISGVALAMKVREQRPGIKVLFTSGYNTETFTGKAMPEDIASLIRKPYKHAQLAQKLRQLLDET